MLTLFALRLTARRSRAHFRRMTEDYFDEILRTAAQRPMTPDEVIGYLDAKNGGMGVCPHVSEAETDGISVPEATFAGSVLRASPTVFALINRDVPDPLRPAIGMKRHHPRGDV